jgi:hypothetical protein
MVADFTWVKVRPNLIITELEEPDYLQYRSSAVPLVEDNLTIYGGFPARVGENWNVVCRYGYTLSGTETTVDPTQFDTINGKIYDRYEDTVETQLIAQTDSTSILLTVSGLASTTPGLYSYNVVGYAGGVRYQLWEGSIEILPAYLS